MSDETLTKLKRLTSAVENFFGTTVILTGRRSGKRELMEATKESRDHIEKEESSDG
jgi:hypothetical protein